MTWRTNVKLLAIAVALTLYVRFFENDRAPWENLGRAFPSLEPIDVIEVAISHPAEAADSEYGADVRPILLRHEKFENELPRWWIVEPFRFPAFHPRVQGIVYELVDLVRVAEVDGEAEIFSTAPVARVRFKTRAGKETVIEVGRDHPDTTLDFCYVRVDGEVFVTRKAFRKNLRASLSELRARALFPVSHKDTARLAIRGTDASTITIEKDEKTQLWRLTEPLRALADRENTETLLDELNSWAVVDFVSDTANGAGALQPYGLSEPGIVVAVSAKDGRVVTLAVGKTVEPGDGPREAVEEQVYVRHPGRPHVFAASVEPLKNLKREPEWFRSRYVFDLQVAEVTALKSEVLTGEGQGQKFTVRRVRIDSEERRDGRVAEPGSYKWQIADERRGESFPADRALVESLLGDLRQLRVEKFLVAGELEPGGLNAPRAKLTLELDSGRSVQLLLGNHSVDPLDAGAGVYYASRPREEGGYLILTRIPQLLDAGAYALRARKISTIEPSSVVEVEIRHDGKNWFLMRPPRGKEWSLSTAHELAPGAKVNAELLGELCMQFEREVFRVSRYLPDEKDLKARDLTPGRARWIVRLKTVGGDTSPQQLYLGSPVEGSRPLEYHARVDREGIPVFTLDEDIPELLRRIHAHLRAITVR